MNHTEARQIFLEAVRSKAGCLYRWGSSGPMNFDCHGLVEFGLWHIPWFKDNMPNLSVKQSAYSFFQDCRVPLVRAKEGSLLYYGDDPENVRHVMILNWPWGVIGARGGDNTTTTDEAAIAAKAYVDTKLLTDYWYKGLQFAADPFIKIGYQYA